MSVMNPYVPIQTNPCGFCRQLKPVCFTASDMFIIFRRIDCYSQIQMQLVLGESYSKYDAFYLSIFTCFGGGTFGRYLVPYSRYCGGGVTAIRLISQFMDAV